MLVQAVQYNLFIWLFFFWGISSLSQRLGLLTTSPGLNSKSPSLSSRFYGCRTKQYITICWELNPISEFFALFWLIFWECGIKKCGWYLALCRGCLLKGPHQISGVSWVFHHSYSDTFLRLSIVSRMPCSWYC